MIGIYKITSPKQRIYIGQSTNIKKRFNHYNRLLCEKQRILYRSFLKYGVVKSRNNFKYYEKYLLELNNFRNLELV